LPRANALWPVRVHGKAGHQEVAARGTSQGGLAARYAAALFDLADEQKQLDSVAGDLVALRGMMAESGDLRRLVGSPVLSRGDQGRAMAALLGAAGSGDLVRRFIGLVAQNRRLFVLPAIIAAYLAQLAQRRGEITAQVTSARPLDERQRQAVAEAVQRAVGGKVAVDAKVDAGLIGGLVVKVGSRMVDSSLRSKLQRLQLTMKGVG
jgi:F-type H+-transporting ATPase subunit delta